jgi:hypothetical protein
MNTFNFRSQCHAHFMFRDRKVELERVLPSGENVIMYGVSLLHNEVRISIDDIVESCKHIIVPFPTYDKE